MIVQISIFLNNESWTHLQSYSEWKDELSETRNCFSSTKNIQETSKSLFSKWYHRSLTIMCILYNGYPIFPGGKKRAGRDADPSLPSRALVKKEYSYTSTPPMGRTACTETQCLLRGALYLTLPHHYDLNRKIKQRRREKTSYSEPEFNCPLYSLHFRNSCFQTEGRMLQIHVNKCEFMNVLSSNILHVEMLRCLDSWTAVNVSKHRTAVIFRVTQVTQKIRRQSLYDLTHLFASRGIETSQKYWIFNSAALSSSNID